ncbi:hypothetical protein Cantr_00313 [Candida viswanathii]|uniref:Uncharacterized protein n=1 Tax=Candida viswanathii TaxID=5486 RepID=A0A367YF87_9ASCO|nr:hypothetical protein Cantr_00313 [Candida viswanathii]
MKSKTVVQESTYPVFQSSLIDGLIPEFTEDSVNLNSSSEFDRLLTHLELSFCNHEALPIPSTNIFRILFTLASRTPDINWTVSSNLLDDVPTSRKRIKPKSSFFEETNTKGNICDRSVKLIETYIQALPNEKLYDVLLNFMNDFTDLPTRRNRGNAPQKQKDVLRIIRESPKKKRRVSEFIDQAELDKTLSPTEVVSDSEDDEQYGGVSRGDNSLMEQEIHKYLSMSVGSSLAFNESLNQSGVNNPSVLFNREESPAPKPKWQGIKVYDEPLLGTRLNPRLNDFDLWRLINFVFYCAGTRNFDFDSNYNNFHMIYASQSATIDQLFSIIEYNLVNELRAIFPDGKGDIYKWLYKQKVARRMIAMDQVAQSSSLLLLLLLKQLGYLRNYWYDRIAEYVFNGLVGKETDSESGSKSRSQSKSPQRLPMPTTCYEHERILIKKSINEYKADTLRSAYYNDNIDSMPLRFKIINIVHYWSLAFDKTTPDGICRSTPLNTNHLETAVLIEEVAKKFMVIEYDYWVEFYYSLLLDSKIPLKYRDILLVSLSCKLLSKLTGSRVWDFKLAARDDKSNPDWRSNNLRIVTNWMKDRELYMGFIEDETYYSFAHFKEIWKKYNFVLGWLFAFALRDVAEVGYQELIDKDLLVQRCMQMDLLREQVYVKFIRDRLRTDNTENGVRFRLTIKAATEYESEPRSWEKFTSIISTNLIA